MTIEALLLDLLAPPRCAWCRSRIPHGFSCAQCRDGLPWSTGACETCALPLPGRAEPARRCVACTGTPPAQDAAWAAFRYEPPVSACILDLKFHARLGSAALLAELMSATLAARPGPLPEVLIPVPLHRARLRQRGYNQALELARALGRKIRIEIAPEAARRLTPTREQTRLTATERRRNVRGAFEVGAVVQGRNIVLLDDVITTGATAAELARVARAAGARRIEVWAVARA